MRQNLKVWFGKSNSDTFLSISWDPMHFFQNRFLRRNRELKPVVLSIINPINGFFFLTHKGGPEIFGTKVRQQNDLKIHFLSKKCNVYIIYQ